MIKIDRQKEYKRGIDYYRLEGGKPVKEDFYEITNSTCALIAKEGGKTEIIEEGRHFIIDRPVAKILRESCEYYGSTLEGRTKGSKSLLGMCYKLPIIIEGSNEIIFFPTKSPLADDCCWMAVKHINSYEAVDNNVLVKFNGGEERLFPLTFDALESQLFRSTKLLLIMRNRQNNQK